MGQMNKLRVMDANEMDRMHEATLKILEETGLTMLSDKAIEYCKRGGCKVDGYTVRFPRAVVKRALETVPHSFRWMARDLENYVTIGGDAEVIGPNLGCVFVQDIDKGRRQAKLEDFVNYQKICQASDVVDVVGSSPVDVSDLPAEHRPLYLTYETIKNTNKPFTGFLTSVEGAKQTLDLLEIACGGKDVMDKNHMAYFSGSPLSPLGYDEKTLDNAIEYLERNQAVNWAPASMGGLTAPMSVYGVSLLCNVESIAGVIFTQLVREGSPTLYGISSTMADMRRGSYNAGSPLEKLSSLVNMQMAGDFYHLPTRVMSGICESKEVDFQAGMETMQNIMMAMLGGANLLYEIVGVTESIMTTSYEKMILDLEAISRARRIKAGVDTTKEEEDKVVAAIQEVGHQGSYMMQKLTRSRCRDIWLPSVSNWDNFDKWNNNGRIDILKVANKKWKEIIASAPESMITPDLDKDLQNYIKKNL